ncbi:MAG: hypothetical protein A3E88_03305 [Legionellales bacterium RIFCSPHIGHO2_12_FULL_35_11]|nr:MAG: hypothetical protein A3E88_03305 [Legionellales bacterium RIFCSPHIGHO2_12_FULL_35_11]
MKYKVFLFLIFIGVGFFLKNATAGEDSLAYYRDFWDPHYHGKLLNYCSRDKKDCGVNIASKFCKLMGYEKSSKALIAYNVGVSIYMDNCPLCKGWDCNAFKLIRCSSNLKHSPVQSYYFREQTFVLPRFEKYRIAWCYENGKGCGYRGAYSFCRRMGFSKTVDYKIDKSIYATKSLGDHKLCFGEECQAFASITCFR